MVVGLVPPDEEERICKKLIAYYGNLYPGVKFTVKRATLARKELGNLVYTFAGDETEASAGQKMRMINSAIGGGYSTPIIILRKKGKDILIDGHRRARVAYKQGLSWKALIIVPSKEIKFGIEAMETGRIKDLYG
jgi:hypothetical protein